MANIKITDLQTPTLIEELDYENLVAVVGGLSKGLEALLKAAETKLEDEINKLAGG
ncbi:hypothetical protein [Nostoc sp. ChiQUE01b]|uniref:hypothetical protein n=1 Tax=Nostoc sp. ChiQUE01b TaxID=3075376 RepID=UPI002AD4AD4F|nr:hypothetical protein [Nostoc sp. ChiQUE01b]MDZ8258049.1 hypothetical protein [Nostoc sp. ChiQUE01b]